MDIQIFRLINGWAGHIAFFDIILKFISIAAIYVSIVVVLLLLLKNRIAAAAGFFGIVIGLALDAYLHKTYFREHPFNALDNVTLLQVKEQSASFPSDTAMMAFAAALAVTFASKRLGKIALPLAFLVAFSRVFVGFHYPSDVLVGMVIGLVITGVGYFLLNTFLTKDMRKKTKMTIDQ